MTLLDLIEEFLFTHYMSETQFGRVCLNDSRLIGDLRRGRQPMMHTREKILKFIEEHEG